MIVEYGVFEVATIALVVSGLEKSVMIGVDLLAVTREFNEG